MVLSIAGTSFGNLLFASISDDPLQKNNWA